MILSAGTYYIKVLSNSGSSATNYSLSLTTTVVTTSGDQYESNNTISTATLLANSSNTIYATIHTTSDVDFYCFTVNENNSRISVSLKDRPVGTNFDFDILSANGTQIFNPQDSTNLNSSVVGKDDCRNFFKIMNSGTYYVRAYTKSGISTLNYKLTVNVSSPSVGYELMIPSVAQRKTNWCWAAVSEMVGQWIFREESNYSQSTTRNQEDCVRLIKHNGDVNITFANLINEGGFDPEYRRAVSFVATGNQNSTKFTDSRTNIYSLAQINSQIFEWTRPIAISIFDNNSGHSLAIRGVNTVDETVFVNDPWNQQLVDTTPNDMVGSAIDRTVLYDDLITNGYIPGDDNRTYQLTIVQNN